MRWLKRCLGLALLMALALALFGCGYSFTGQGAAVGPDPDAVSRLDPAFRSMALARVDSPAIEPWLEPRLRSLIRDEFTRRRFVVWTDKDKATALLTVTIKKFTRSTSVAGQQDQSLKLSTGISFVFRVHRASDGALLWDSGEQTQKESFFPGDAEGADLRITDLAVRRMADLLTQNY
jgi:hypothetical protein